MGDVLVVVVTSRQSSLDKFGIGPNVFFRSHVGKSHEYVDRR